MGLLNFVKDIKENMNGNNSLPLGTYTVKLTKVSHRTLGGHEVYKFIYTFNTPDGKSKLSSMLFVNPDKIKC